MLQKARNDQKVHLTKTSSGRHDYGKYRKRAVYAMGPAPP
jgi:hypothetical protein